MLLTSRPHIMLEHAVCVLLGLFGTCWAGPFSVVAKDRIGFSFNEKVEIVRQVNNYRRNAGASNMEQMFWHWGLQNLAQTWANRCEYKHNSDRHRIEGFEYRYVGENMYITWPWHNASDPHKEWYAEINNFHPNGTCVKGYPCGHYAQMIWHDTEAIGCALRFCDKGTPINYAFFVVCDYGPLGNKPFKPMFNKGEACSKCPAGKECKDKLCAPPNCNGVTCQNGVLIEDVCMCNCTGSGFDGEFCEIDITDGSSETSDKPPTENVATIACKLSGILQLSVLVPIFYIFSWQ